jgi:hypothetical protein
LEGRGSDCSGRATLAFGVAYISWM